VLPVACPRGRRWLVLPGVPVLKAAGAACPRAPMGKAAGLTAFFGRPPPPLFGFLCVKGTPTRAAGDWSVRSGLPLGFPPWHPTL
jgi:hypothetical protein